MFVALSKFIIANGMSAEVKTAFQNRPHLVDDVAGFIRLDVISPLENPEEIWLITYWEDAASYHQWHHGEQHHQSHQGIPKGLKLIPGANEIRFFEYICS
ncbi:MAG: antibiotic biosynthesis monooxygenase [Thiotrichaceae bacterium]